VSIKASIPGRSSTVRDNSVYFLALRSGLTGALIDAFPFFHREALITGDRVFNECKIWLTLASYLLTGTGLLSQTRSGVTSYYLQDGQGGANEYYLGDALGSTRQVVDDGGSVALARGYSPYGESAYNSGTAQTDYGFTNEYTSQGLIYLRARHYVPEIGRFLTRDPWGGDYNRPLSLNRWMYTEGNPINFTDPTGQITEKESKRAELILEKLDNIYDVQIKKDWGYLNEFIYYPNLYIDPSNTLVNCKWEEGDWRSLRELELTLEAVKDMSKTFGSQKGLFNTAMRWRLVWIRRLPIEYVYDPDKHGAYSINNAILPNNVFNSSDKWAKGQIVHELAHIIDYRQWWPPFRLSNGMAALTKSFKDGVYDEKGQIEPPPSGYAKGNAKEDWAESFKFFVYPSFGYLGPIRKGYIESFIKDMKTP